MNTIEKLYTKNEKYLLLGDFNIELLKYHDDPNVTEFVDVNFEHGSVPLITKPTRI